MIKKLLSLLFGQVRAEPTGAIVTTKSLRWMDSNGDNVKVIGEHGFSIKGWEQETCSDLVKMGRSEIGVFSGPVDVSEPVTISVAVTDASHYRELKTKRSHTEAKELR